MYVITGLDDWLTGCGWEILVSYQCLCLPSATAVPSTQLVLDRWNHVHHMYHLLKSSVKRSQMITFPVKASLLQDSVPALKWLCEQFDASLTVYQSGETDAVDIPQLVYLRSRLPKTRVYYDLQPNTLNKFVKHADNLELLTAGNQLMFCSLLRYGHHAY